MIIFSFSLVTVQISQRHLQLRKPSRRYSKMSLVNGKHVIKRKNGINVLIIGTHFKRGLLVFLTNYRTPSFSWLCNNYSNLMIIQSFTHCVVRHARHRL